MRVRQASAAPFGFVQSPLPWCLQAELPPSTCPCGFLRPLPPVFHFNYFSAGPCVLPTTHTHIRAGHSTAGLALEPARWARPLQCGSSYAQAQPPGPLPRAPFPSLEFPHISPQTSCVYLVIFKLYTHKTPGKNTN